jgi:hypothetical protein
MKNFYRFIKEKQYICPECGERGCLGFWLWVFSSVAIGFAIGAAMVILGFMAKL